MTKTSSKAKKTAKKKVLAPAAEQSSKGKIVTFYSYKGGTGRSMSMANIAWILASAGHRVLVIDWDFEAPGLHRYFRPFLDDPELSETRGLLDFFWEFSEAARVQAALPKGRHKPADDKWFLPFADLTRYAVSLNYDFPKKSATLDMIGAGRQGPAYAMKATTFGWNDFYENLGGGVFLEHVKKHLKADYDYILIDSRTGLSDTSGICTVQMPDEVMVFFTLNRQSILGASAVANSIRDQRRLPSGANGICIWPVATRLDQAEKERLESALAFGEDAFRDHLWHITRKERTGYWGRCRIPHIPFYSYEEVLAAFADHPGSTGTMLNAMETLAGCLVGKATLPLSLGNGSTAAVAKQRAEILGLFGATSRSLDTAKSSLGRNSKVFISYSQRDIPVASVRKITRAFANNLDVEVLWDDVVPLGSPFISKLESMLLEADLVILLIGPEWLKSEFGQKEYKVASVTAKRLIPVLLIDKLSWNVVPRSISDLRGFPLSLRDFDHGITHLTSSLGLKFKSEIAAKVYDPEDPQKGRWGGRASVNGRTMSATVTEISRHWFKVTIEVHRKNGAPFEGEVRFHIHDSFPETERIAPIHQGKAVLVLECYGGFTVGAEMDDGRTTLELDLAKLPKAPKIFRET